MRSGLDQWGIPEAMPNMRGIASRVSAATALLVGLASIASTKAADCPRKGILGTSRNLTVNPAVFPRVGLRSFPQSLPLRDHEVVLTFDDGPWPPTTAKVLGELAQQCVRATFFLIGKNASEHPDLVRRIAAQGHTIGHHTWSHRSLMRIEPAETKAEIEQGIAAVERALHGVASTIPTTPFFRFPGFESTPATLEFLQSRGISVFGADFWASDWLRVAPNQELNLLIQRLKAAGRGIILLHDTKAATAAMLPAFLRYLRDHDYHVVHLVPQGPAVDAEAAP
jgi:peptidoglycan/xylan/chitin deacetylase (PgdA/CDA1 family)